MPFIFPTVKHFFQKKYVIFLQSLQIFIILSFSFKKHGCINWVQPSSTTLLILSAEFNSLSTQQPFIYTPHGHFCCSTKLEFHIQPHAVACCNCGCHLPGSVQGQVGWDLEQPCLVAGVEGRLELDDL